MLVNKKINDVLTEISNETIRLHNSKDLVAEYNYVKRLYNFIDKKMAEDDKITLLIYLLHNLHFKNILTDPETMLAANNIKLRTIFIIYMLSIILLIIAAILFKTNSGLNELITILQNVLNAINLTKG